MSRASQDVVDTTLPPLRYEGDGLDHRRPIASQAPQNVIDLTEEPDTPPAGLESARPAYNLMQDDDISMPSTPASGGIWTPDIQEIIEVDDNSSPVPVGSRHSDQSPELEVLHSRPANRAQETGVRRAHVRNRGQGLAPYLTELHTPAPGRAVEYPPAPLMYIHQMLSRIGQREEPRQDLFTPRTHHGRNFTLTQGPDWMPTDFTAFAHAAPDVRLPGNLDFAIQGFQMEGINRLQSFPTYKAPPSPRPGFTRSPKEDQVIICPNCDQELAVGESEVQRQVWVSKGCGHVGQLPKFSIHHYLPTVKVYCGQCAQNRHKSRTKRGTKPSTSKTFKTCVVDGCGKLLSSPKNMFQLYL